MLELSSAKKLRPGVQWFLLPGILALIGTSGAAFYFWIVNRPADPVPVSLVTVGKGDVESSVNESGVVELRGQKTLKSPTEGAVENVLVKPGQRVRAGQVLLTLRYPERQTALANQQLLIRQQELTLEQNRQRVLDAKEKLAIEERKLKNLVDLVSQGAITQQLFQDQEDRVRTARITLRESESTVAMAQFELERSQLERQRILQQLQNSVIASPIDAIVLDVKVKDGDGVELRTELLTLGDPNQEYVQTRLSTLDARQVRLNQLARISILGPNPEVFTGRVRSIYPQAVYPEQPKQGTNRSSEQATVPAVIKLDRPTRKLLPGSQVNVEIVLEQGKNVVTLNPEAIQRSQEETFVWVRDSNNKAQKRSIVTGIEGLLEVEITSGLRPGEQVILPPAEPALQPGMPVTTEKKL
ncbi:MAG: efflux RND transporter periplasmic adaptor subunit [Leptolyngbyaceae cyanobacterium HOT.MB2.61]|nr:efflux RND transporter periplasmic adaptor subunit [Leptolyngbyaceae cyanobacterium HOT.MB2.61]